MHKNIRNIKGIKFGQLTALEYKGSSWNRRALWLFQCDCGTEVIREGHHVVNGVSKSCGCLQRKNGRDVGTSNLIPRKPSDDPLLDSLYSRYRSGAETRNLEFKLTKLQVKKLFEQNCIYCGISPSNLSHNVRNNKNPQYYRYNGIDRKDNVKGYVFDNCVTCCKACNVAKASMSVEEFLGWVTKVFYYSAKELV